MKILIYGDSNTWGYIPNINGYSSKAIPQQYPQEDIWWNILTKDHKVVVNGLCGRAINNEGLWQKGRNAYKTCEQDIKGINPDLIVLQLGTNDCKHAYGNTSTDIIIALVELIHKMEKFTGAKFVLISPSRLKPGNKITDKYYKDAEKKTEELDALYKKLANINGYGFVSGLDLETGEDSEHLTIKGHKILSEKIRYIVNGFDLANDQYFLE